MPEQWFESLAFDAAGVQAGDSTPVVIVPIGTFDTSAMGHLPDKLTISRKLAEELVKNFDAQVLKTQPFVDDGGHNEDRASGWIDKLWVGEFPHAVTGEMKPGLLAEIKWTSLGQKLLSERLYRYLSAVIARYRDEETGQDYQVLRSATLTNKPVMKMMPAVTLAAAEATDKGVEWGAWAAPQEVWVQLSELSDPIVSVNDRLLGDQPRDENGRFTSGDGSGDSEDPEYAAAKKEYDDAEKAWVAAGSPKSGPEADRLRAAIEKNRATYPHKRIYTAEPGYAPVPKGTPPEPKKMIPDPPSEEPAEEGDASGDIKTIQALVDAGSKEDKAAFARIVSKVKGKADDEKDEKPKGGTKMAELTLAEVAAERDTALTELAELRRAERTREVTAVLDEASAKGLIEPARNVLEAILMAESGDIVLAEDADPIDLLGAVHEFVKLMELVPVKTKKLEDAHKEGDLPADVAAAKARYDEQLGMSEFTQ